MLRRQRRQTLADYLRFVTVCDLGGVYASMCLK